MKEKTYIENITKKVQAYLKHLRALSLKLNLKLTKKQVIN